MKKNEILELVKSLANSQGFYTGLYQFLNSNTLESEQYLDHLESKNFKDAVDFILYLEG